MSNPYLLTIRKGRDEQGLEIVDKVFIGRGCQGIDEEKRLIVDEKLVSRDHAVISWNGSQLKIKDTSRNGTWVNGVRISAGMTRRLLNEDVIQIGETTIKVYCPTPPPPGEEEEDSTVIKTEQVIVSNLVADLKGFTGISQREDSARVFALVKRIFGVLTSIINDYRGTIKDYAGDAVFAFWDHRAHSPGNCAILVCRAAIEQVRAVDSMREELSGVNPMFKDVRLGWGITTGKVTISDYGSRGADIAIVGDSTNLAFRLSDIANKQAPNEIVICSQTAELVRGSVPLVELGSLPIRGRSGKEKVFGVNV